jgi:hypothetical protein
VVSIGTSSFICRQARGLFIQALFCHLHEAIKPFITGRKGEITNKKIGMSLQTSVSTRNVIVPIAEDGAPHAWRVRALNDVS